MGRIWNGLSGTEDGPVIGRQSPYTGVLGGRGLQRAGKTSWVPGNFRPPGFGNPPNEWDCGLPTWEPVSLWTFGEGTGTTLPDVAPLTLEQNLLFDVPQGTGAGLVTSSNFYMELQ